jgi:endoglucanase
MMRRWRLVVAALAVVATGVGGGTTLAGAHAAPPTVTAPTVTAQTATPTVTAPTSHRALGLHVAGNHFVNASGDTVRLIGFNNSGAEYACVEGWGIFDVDTRSNTSVPVRDVVAMARWSGANAVRVSLNEQCWLGIGDVKARYGGANYRRAIKAYVRELTSHGFAVILNLHLNAPGDERAINQEPMPDAHSIPFWTQVARSFKSNTAVLFDLFNEPWPDNQSGSAKAWRCWRDGGCRQVSQNGGETYTAVGMNQLIKAVRSTGADNVVLAGGVNYASSLGKWLEYKPTDPDHNLAASIHLYSFNGCTTRRCYDKTPARVARRVPLVIGEFGPDLTVGYSASLDSNCPASDVGHTGFDTTLLGWAAAHGASWTAWTWNPWGDCWSLVKGFSGRPTTPYGVRVRKALLANRQSHPA